MAKANSLFRLWLYGWSIFNYYKVVESLIQYIEFSNNHLLVNAFTNSMTLIFFVSMAIREKRNGRRNFSIIFLNKVCIGLEVLGKKFFLLMPSRTTTSLTLQLKKEPCQ